MRNLKGGVGKTAAAVNLADAAAADGYATLLCDLDAQGAASYYFRVRPQSVSAKKPVKGSSDIEEAIKATDYENLDLLPASLSFRKLSAVLDDEKHRRRRLRDALKPFSARYDLIVLDTHAALDLQSEADHELDLSRIRAFFSMVDRRRKLHRETIDQLRGTDSRVLTAAVPYSSDVEKMGTYREPVLARSRTSRGAAAYHELWQELRPALLA